MNEKIDKEFVSYFCRLTLLEILCSTNKKYDKSVRKWIMTEASYEDVLSLVISIDQPSVLYEYETDAQRRARYNKKEREINFLASVPMSVISSIAAGGVASAAGGGIGGGILAGYTTMALGSLLRKGFSSITKVIKAKLLKLNSKNREICRDKYKNAPPTSKHIMKELVDECVVEARMAEYRKLIADLRNQLRDCPNTKFPERCAANITKEIQKIEMTMKKDQNELAEIRDKMAKKKREYKPKPIGGITAKRAGGGENPYMGRD